LTQRQTATLQGYEQTNPKLDLNKLHNALKAIAKAQTQTSISFHS
jgi:hypothetical protein